MILLGRYQLLKGYGEHHVSVGFGSYGQVKLAVDKKTGENVAVKIINKIAKNQVGHHTKLFHPKIIQLLDSTIDPERETTYMILEYASGGTLFDKIRDEALSKEQIKSYFKDVCEAIDYLHTRQIMHRDIKPENILLTSTGTAKLCDFGFAAILGPRKTLCGTYQYMSPEMVQNRPYDSKIDIWALGILLFQMIAKEAPFKGNSPEQVLNQMKTKIFFSEKFTPEEIALIKSIIRVTPHKRPSIKDILANPYFNSTHSQVASQKTYTTEEHTSSKYLNNYNHPGNVKPNTYGSHNVPNYYKPPENTYLSYSAKIKPIDPELLQKSGIQHTNKGNKSPIRTAVTTKTTLSKTINKLNTSTNHHH